MYDVAFPARANMKLIGEFPLLKISMSSFTAFWSATPFIVMLSA